MVVEVGFSSQSYSVLPILLPSCLTAWWSCGGACLTSRLVASMPHAWRFRVSARTGWLSVSIPRLGEIASLMCDFCFSVTACALVKADA